MLLYVIETMVEYLGITKPHKKRRFSKIRKTIASEDFKKLYENIEKEYGQEIEKNRKKTIKTIIICLLLFAIEFSLLMFLSYIFKINLRYLFRKLKYIFIMPILYFFYKYKEYNDEYKRSFKRKIIKNFIQYINPNLKYIQNGGKSLHNYYIDANFEDEKDENFNTFETDDYIEGYSKEGIFIQISNISLQKKDARNIFLKMIYEGIFSVTKLNKYISDEVKIKKNSIILKKNNRIELDSEDFEKYFDVYSKSNILTNQILTQNVMEKLVQFYNTYKIDFEIIIKNNNIYIRFNTGAMFEPNILRKSNDINTLWVYYNVLKFVISITNDFNKLIENVEL